MEPDKKEEVVQEEAAVEQVEEKVEDRPEENYKAELARKNAEIARLRAEREQFAEKQVKHDPADISTWSDNDLKALRSSNDPNLARYKDSADELLLERKVRAIQARDYENRRKEESQKELEREFPEALDSSSEFYNKMDKVMRDYDLHRSPAGRLVAAKIVASEGKNNAAKGQHNEVSRVNRVKNQMVDGDRPKPTEGKQDVEAKRKDLAEGLMDTKNESRQVEAVKDALKDRGISRENFFKR